MTLPRWLPWAGTAGFVLVLIVSVFLYAENREAVGEANQLRDQNERLEQVSDSLRDRNDSLARQKSRADSAAREDSLRLAHARDSLQVERRRAEAARREAEVEADNAADALEATLAALRAKALEVAPSLVPAVDTARAQLAAHQRADQRVEAGWQDQMAAQVELTEGWRETAGINFDRWQRSEDESFRLEQERDALREQVSGLQEENDKLWSIVDPPLIQQLLGRNLLEGATTVVTGVAAWAYDPMAGLGWTAEKGRQLMF